MTKLPMIDRLRVLVGLSPRASTSGYPSYGGANLTRLNADWIGTLLSSDQEIRTSLKRLRARCRQLHNNNDYAQKFVSLVKQNVVGPGGINLEARVLTAAGEMDEKANDAIEDAWNEWCEVGNCTADQQLGFRDVLNLAWESLVVDGEVFLRKVRGIPGNPFRFALQFIDPDQVDVSFNRMRQDTPNGVENEIRMGIEVDQWNRRVAYWVYKGHPSEGHAQKERVPASEMLHCFILRRPNQTRGVPFFVTAMSRMNMLGGYEEAELVAARMGACKMAVITSKTGEEYTGAINKTTGAVQTTLEPGTMDQLPEGMDMKPIDFQHPGNNFENFVQQMIRGMAVGLNVSYAALAGDLRQVNFSSIRQGALEERDAWRSLQAFAVEHLCKPIFEDWLLMAIASRQLELPASGDIDEFAENVVWQPRGWTWVDPLKDVEASIAALGAGITTLAEVCADRGKDWRDVLEQQAIEFAYAKKLGLTLNYSRPKPASIGTTPEDTSDPNAPPPPDGPSDEQRDGGAQPAEGHLLSGLVEGVVQ